MKKDTLYLLFILILFRSNSGFHIQGSKATILGWGGTRDQVSLIEVPKQCDLMKAHTKVTPYKGNASEAFYLYAPG